MNEFKVNNLITVKLENGKSVIYVGKERFTHCKFLLLTIPIEEIRSFDKIESIDEAALVLDKRLEPDIYRNKEDFEADGVQKPLISPTVEFWANCSNLQVWAENDYNTNLLHSNLAFPLLKKLVEVGDPLAKRALKKEIAKRLESGFPPVVEFLVLQKYLDYLNNDELQAVIENPKVIEALVQAGYKNEEDEYVFDGIRALVKKVKAENSSYLKTLLYKLLQYDNEELLYYLDRSGLKHELDWTDLAFALLTSDEAKAVVELQSQTQEIIDFAIAPEYGGGGGRIFIKDRHVTELILSYCGLTNVPNQILKLKKLELLSLSGNFLSAIPDFMFTLKNLTYLDLSKNNISTVPEKIGALIRLEELGLSSNRITHLPESIGRLKSLKMLSITENPIISLPKSLVQCSGVRIIWKKKKNKKNY